jgi:phage gp36-like protein
MGDYLVIADLEARFNSAVEVAYLTGTESTGVPDAARENEAIVAGEGDINSRIGRMYLTGATLVVSPIAADALAVLKAYSTDCAEYRLRMNLGQSVSDDKTKMYERALAWAEAIGTGKFVLTGAAIVQSSAANSKALWSTWNRTYNTDDARDVSRASAGAI